MFLMQNLDLCKLYMYMHVCDMEAKEELWEKEEGQWCGSVVMRAIKACIMYMI